MDRFDTLHHQISEQKLINSVQAHQIKNLEGGTQTDATKVILSAMQALQTRNVAKLAELEKELAELD